MKAMGIDSSTSCTGWAILDTENNEVIASGHIKPTGKTNTIQKIIYITRVLKDIFREYEPEYINIEEVVVIRNAQTQRMLTALLYYIVIEFTKENVIINTVRPTEWRKGKIKGKCRAELKANCMKYVESKYNTIATEDEADAIVIAEYNA